MSLNPFDALEKLITEHGSAAILGQHLAFIKEKYEALEKQVSKLEAKLEIEQDSHNETKQRLQRLIDEHSEEIRVYRAIEFRRGKRTGGNWVAFCPVCHSPADTSMLVMCANTKCQWRLVIPGNKVAEFIEEFSSGKS